LNNSRYGLDPLNDQELIERAKSGDQDAFSELVMKHRSKVVNWAKSITHDAYLAEDIAQDALLRSYFHLESLDHADRFLPWLRSIVRNKAIDALRKNNRKTLYIKEPDTIDTNTPEIVSLRKEWMESIAVLLGSLPERNRQIFEAHFFRQFSPEEIAQQFQITTSNVYNIISRSKIKLQEERFKRETVKFIQQRKAWNQTKSILLSTPHFRSSYTSLGHVLYEVLPYMINAEFTLSDVMALSGQAFRIQMTMDCGMSSSLIYDWGWVLERAAITFGCRTQCIGRPGKVLTPDTLIHALDNIHQSIEGGSPVIVWNLSRAEFGIVYGYNDESCRFTYRNAVEHSLEVPYEKLGRTLENPELFVGLISCSSSNQHPRSLLVYALETIIDHARGKEPDILEYVKGIAAYETWISAFETDQAQPVGHAYQVTLLTEARAHAVTFLENWAQYPIIQKDPIIATLWMKALQHYKEVHRALLQLYPSFPYGMPGVQIDIREHSIGLLRRAMEAEESGIALFEKIYLQLVRYN
jgi:RNA polymerase sigma factor (sigma-70 family)